MEGEGRSFFPSALSSPVIIIIIIIPLFTLGSIYSTNASAAEQMLETNNSNCTLKTGLKIPTITDEVLTYQGTVCPIQDPWWTEMI